MVSRLIIHTKNFFYSLKWIRLNLNNLRKQLESQGYYSISICKFFLWKSRLDREHSKENVYYG